MKLKIERKDLKKLLRRKIPLIRVFAQKLSERNLPEEAFARIYNDYIYLITLIDLKENKYILPILNDIAKQCEDHIKKFDDDKLLQMQDFYNKLYESHKMADKLYRSAFAFKETLELISKTINERQELQKFKKELEAEKNRKKEALIVDEIQVLEENQELLPSILKAKEIISKLEIKYEQSTTQVERTQSEIDWDIECAESHNRFGYEPSKYKIVYDSNIGNHLSSAQQQFYTLIDNAKDLLMFQKRKIPTLANLCIAKLLVSAQTFFRPEKLPKELNQKIDSVKKIHDIMKK